MDRSQRGALTEIRITADLMLKGWQVFRAVSQHATCDLIGISPKGRLVRIECTAARTDRFGKKVVFVPHDRENYDLICGVHSRTNKIVYAIDPSQF